MALRTLGTAATTTLSAVRYSQNPNDTVAYSGGVADLPALAVLIKDDLNALSVSPNKLFDYNGWLMIPRRGLIRLFPGDFVAVDATGWPIALSAAAAANANWVHT